MTAYLEGRVCVTGGSGFLARAIYRRARREHWPVEFTAFNRDDHKAAHLHGQYPEVHTIRGDVSGDRDALVAAFRGHDIVIHAAANKHVDLSESNVLETVRTNIDGSINVGWAAIRAGVPRVIGISTDKAAAPLNTYGLTKAVMERSFQEFARISQTVFQLTRYGNVIASTGSVLTLFQKQVEQYGHVRLTDPAMTRFWMTADQAIDAILQATGVPSGFTYVPVCGAMTLADLADTAAPGARVEVVGVRPGEKIHETLLGESETYRTVFAEGGEYLGEKVTHGFVIAPMTETRPSLIRPEPYTSENPFWWWKSEQMLDAICDAETI